MKPRIEGCRSKKDSVEGFTSLSILEIPEWYQKTKRHTKNVFLLISHFDAGLEAALKKISWLFQLE